MKCGTPSGHWKMPMIESGNWSRNSQTRKPRCDKAVYPDKKAAVSAMNVILRDHRRNRPRHLRAYWCDGCRGWHLTKQDNDALDFTR